MQSPSEILSHGINLETWWALCDFANELTGADLESYIEQALPILEQWPDHLRVLPMRWCDVGNIRCRLARSLQGVFYCLDGDDLVDFDRFYPTQTILSNSTFKEDHTDLIEHAYYIVENLNMENNHLYRSTYVLKDGHLLFERTTDGTTYRYQGVLQDGGITNSNLDSDIDNVWSTHSTYLSDAEDWLERWGDGLV